MDRRPRPDLERVFRTNYPRVVSVARRVLGDTDAAQDAAQEVFLGFARCGVPEAEAGGWLSVAAVHVSLNMLRSDRRRIGRESDHGSDPSRVDEAGVAADAGDAADAALRRLERARVRAALAALTRQQAVALVLRHSGMTYAEIADALGIAASGVGTTIRRAEAALREELSRDESRA